MVPIPVIFFQWSRSRSRSEEKLLDLIKKKLVNSRFFIDCLDEYQFSWSFLSGFYFDSCDLYHISLQSMHNLTTVFSSATNQILSFGPGSGPDEI
jgi:hypothetical protein